MPLTDAQKASCRRYLGYPDVNRRQNTHLEAAFTALSSEGVDQVVAMLANIAAVDTQLATIRGRSGFAKVEDVSFDTAGSIGALQAERRQLVRELGSTLDVAPAGSSPYLGRG